MQEVIINSKNKGEMISLLCYINLRKLGGVFAGSHYNYTSISKQSHNEMLKYLLIQVAQNVNRSIQSMLYS